MEIDAPATATAATAATGKATLLLEQQLTGHTDRVWCASWSHNGKALATSGADKVIRVWQAAAVDRSTAAAAATATTTAAYHCTSQLDSHHTRTIRSLSWHPSNEIIASAGFDGVINVYKYQSDNDSDSSSSSNNNNSDSNSQQRDWQCISTLEGHENEVKCVSWNPYDPNLLASCSRDKTIWLWLYDAAADDFECVSVLNGHSQDVKFICWLDDGTLLSASYDNSIKIWRDEDEDWYCVQTLSTATTEAHSSTVWCVAVNPNNNNNNSSSSSSSSGCQQFVSCSDDNSIIVWQRNSSTNLFEFAARVGDVHQRTIYSVDWNSNNMIVSAGADDQIAVYSVTTTDAPAATATTVEATATTETAAATTTAAAAAATTPTVTITVVATLHNAHSGDVNGVTWHPTDNHLIASVSDDGTAALWRLVL